MSKGAPIQHKSRNDNRFDLLKFPLFEKLAKTFQSSGTTTTTKIEGAYNLETEFEGRKGTKEIKIRQEKKHTIGKGTNDDKNYSYSYRPNVNASGRIFLHERNLLEQNSERKRGDVTTKRGLITVIAGAYQKDPIDITDEVSCPCMGMAKPKSGLTPRDGSLGQLHEFGLRTPIIGQGWKEERTDKSYKLTASGTVHNKDFYEDRATKVSIKYDKHSEKSKTSKIDITQNGQSFHCTTTFNTKGNKTTIVTRYEYAGKKENRSGVEIREITQIDAKTALAVTKLIENDGGKLRSNIRIVKAWEKDGVQYESVKITGNDNGKKYSAKGTGNSRSS